VAEADWLIDIEQRQARHRPSGMVLLVMPLANSEFSVRPVLSTLPNVVGEPDTDQVKALHQEIQRRVMEGGALLVKAVANAQSPAGAGR
jgi:hypothetical protein